MSDQNKMSPYNINTISSRQVIRLNQILKMKGFTSFAVFKLEIWNAGIRQGTGEQVILLL